MKKDVVETRLDYHEKAIDGLEEKYEKIDDKTEKTDKRVDKFHYYLIFLIALSAVTGISQEGNIILGFLKGLF